MPTGSLAIPTPFGGHSAPHVEGFGLQDTPSVPRSTASGESSPGTHVLDMPTSKEHAGRDGDGSARHASTPVAVPRHGANGTSLGTLLELVGPGRDRIVWPSAHAWKACWRTPRLVGSNPTPSARIRAVRQA